MKKKDYELNIKWIYKYEAIENFRERYGNPEPSFEILNNVIDAINDRLGLKYVEKLCKMISVDIAILRRW